MSQDTGPAAALLVGAAGYGDLSQCKRLVASGVEVDAADPDGLTPMMAACASGHLHVVKYLASKGAKTTRVTAQGLNIAHLAARNGQLEVLEWLHMMGHGHLFFERDTRDRIPTDSSASGAVKRFFRKIGADQAPPRRREEKGAAEAQDAHMSVAVREHRASKRAFTLDPDKGNKAEPRTVFRRETDDEVARGKADATRPLEYQPRSGAVECPAHLADVHGPTHIPMPRRPEWTSDMITGELEAAEKQYFNAWLESIYSLHTPETLNQFEHNLDVWRQLWRVVERSDILLLLVDSRCPALHFPRSLYDYILDNGKGVVLCLTKADIVPSDLIEAWTNFFLSIYPDLIIVPFTAAFSRSAKIEGGQESVAGLISAVRVAVERLIVGVAAVDVTFEREEKDGRKVTGDEGQSGAEEDSAEDEEGDEGAERVDTEEDSQGPALDQVEEYEQGVVGGRKYITVGIVGEPNMGKSSLLNTVLQRKKVSVSATPGHTKHLQTHYYNKTLVFCDCPGVVFPRVGVKRPLQVLMGSYPIAQVREPFAVIRYLAERCNPPLHERYKLRFPVESAKLYAESQSLGRVKVEDEDDERWSPYLLAEAYATQQGFYTKGRGGRPDVNRAANKILRDALLGRSCVLAFAPPSWSSGSLTGVAGSMQQASTDPSASAETLRPDGDKPQVRSKIQGKKQRGRPGRRDDDDAVMKTKGGLTRRAKRMQADMVAQQQLQEASDDGNDDDDVESAGATRRHNNPFSVL